MEYAFRKSAFEKEKTYLLTREGTEVTDHEGAKTLYPYVDVVEVKTTYVASRNHSFFQCTLNMANGTSVLLKSQHYRGLADFENRDEAYRTFVKELHKLLAVANPNVLYRKGIGVISYLASMIIFVVAGLLFPIVSIGALITGSLIYGIVGVIGSIILVLRMIRYGRRNKPGKYLPENIPDQLLPTIKH